MTTIPVIDIWYSVELFEFVDTDFYWSQPRDEHITPKMLEDWIG